MSIMLVKKLQRRNHQLVRDRIRSICLRQDDSTVEWTLKGDRRTFKDKQLSFVQTSKQDKDFSTEMMSVHHLSVSGLILY